jgi:AraC-like DNA-binding protein
VRIAAAEYRIASGSVYLFHPNSRRTRVEPPADRDLFRANALLIPIRALQDQVQASRDDGSPWNGLPDDMPLATRLPEVLRLSELLNFVTRQFDAGIPISGKAAAAMSVLVEDLLSAAILRVTPLWSEERVLPAAQSRVRKAEEIMRARSNEPLSITDVAREGGVSLRSLQLAFIEARAMEPRDVLLRMRLERARERLQSAGPAEAVTTIALDCGFAHLGRFPATYRAAFGELPTETLTRTRRRLA